MAGRLCIKLQIAEAMALLNCSLRSRTSMQILQKFAAGRLYTASIEGPPDVIKLLLTVPNVGVNATDNGNKTPLLTATIEGYRDVIELLLTVPNVDVNAV